MTPKPLITTVYRKEFVQFLFSLCVAQIAVFLAVLASIDPLFDPRKLATFTHLLMALVVVWTSWFGWRRSVESQKLNEQYPFGKAAFLALLDIFLVITYFELVRTSDITNVDQSKRHPVTALLESPTPLPEAYLISIMFVLFLVWDCFSKAAAKIKFWESEDWKTPWPSAVCFLISLFVFGVSREVDKSANVVAASYIDLSLIFVVLSFRTLKQIQMILRQVDKKDPALGDLRLEFILLTGWLVLGSESLFLGYRSPIWWPNFTILP